MFLYLCTVKLHVFNPEHDISLGLDSCRFTLPKAVAHLKRAFDFLPVIWADDGDLILVDDVERALAGCYKLGMGRSASGRKGWGDVLFVTPDMLGSAEWANRITAIEGWGMDKKLLTDILTIQPRLAPMVPGESYLANVRNMSARFWAAEKLVPKFQTLPHVVVEARRFSDYTLLYNTLQAGRRYVVKAPWSSSGRGVRLLEPSFDARSAGMGRNVHVDSHQENWIKNVIRAPGCVMLEPYWAGKVMDFGMEFEADSTGIRYQGLSIFKAKNGAYLGNLLDTEENKRQLLAAHVDMKLLDSLTKAILRELAGLIVGNYTGPFGIDMMLLEDGRINPLVELNLRRTMGHVAIQLYARTRRKGWMVLNPAEACVDVVD